MQPGRLGAELVELSVGQLKRMKLPENIYGTTGEWELYASPSRDARLKAAFRELYESLSGLARSSALVAELRTQAGG